MAELAAEGQRSGGGGVERPASSVKRASARASERPPAALAGRSGTTESCCQARTSLWGRVGGRFCGRTRFLCWAGRLADRLSHPG